MSRLALTLSLAVVSASLTATAQNAPLTGTPAAYERAALDMPAFSSSSTPDLFAAAAQSSITTQSAPPVVNRPQGSTRPFSSIGVGVKVGTSGIGFDVATPIVPGLLNLRGGASFFSYNTTITTDNININGSLKFRNSEVVADLFPFRNFFRISGGMTIYNNTGLSANLTVPANQSFTLGNDTYYSSQSNPITGTGLFNFGGKTAGRVSIGTGNMLPKKGHFAFETEIGVQFFSSPTVVYNISGNGCSAPNNPATCGPINQSDVQAEQTKLQNDLTDLKYFPTVSFGLSYKIH